MHPLEITLCQRIAAGLRRRSIKLCSRWAEEYRVMGVPFPGQWTFDHHPWVKDMHDCGSELIVGQKAAQMAFTELALNKCFYAIDISGQSVLYVLPASTPDAKDFSTSRFDPALENCKHLRQLFTDVKNIHHKRAGFANLFIRGSRSRSQMKSVPAGLIILDEVDEMVQNNISLVFERVSGQTEYQIIMISTPTIDNYGINYYFKQSSQDHYFFKCPHCSRFTELIFPACLVITANDINDINIVNSHLICKECKHVLNHEAKIDFLSINNAKWVTGYTNRLSRGFHINQLYSMTVKPYVLAQAFFRAQHDAHDEQEFYNSKLGLTHTVEGAKISDENITACIGEYKMPSNNTSGMVTMGVDVGKVLHYEIASWSINARGSDLNAAARSRVLKVGTVNDFEDLDNLVRQYRVLYTIVDANPERRKAFEFASRFWGYARICFYGRGIIGKTIHLHDDAELSLTVDRTSWLDCSLGRFKARTVQLPQDTPLAYKEQIKAPVRVYTKDPDGNPTGHYVTGHEDDHYAHAHTYAEIALTQAVELSQNQNISIGV